MGKYKTPAEAARPLFGLSVAARTMTAVTLSGADMPYLAPQETADLFELPVRLPWPSLNPASGLPQHLIYFAHCAN